MGIAFAGLICTVVIAASILMIASGLLRLAIYATNRIVSPSEPKARSGGIAEWDWDDWDDEAAEPPEPVRPWQRHAIPEAGTLKCVGIAFLTGLVFGLGFVLLGFAVEELGLRMRHVETRLAVAVLNFPIAGLALTVLLSLTLPTNFWRAGLVAFVYGLIIVAFLVFVGAVVFVVATLLR
jgi:hypothetical protein